MDSKYIISAKWALILLITIFIISHLTGVLIAVIFELFLTYEYSFRAAKEAIKKKGNKNKNLGTEVGFYVPLFAVLPCLLLSLFTKTSYLSLLILIIFGLIGGKRADQNSPSVLV